MEVDIAARRLRMLDAFPDALAQHDIAVGRAEKPTRTGKWTITQVVLNPEWIFPADESWAKDEKSGPPGDVDNPLGEAQLVFDLPRSIHGTNAPTHQRTIVHRPSGHARFHSRDEPIGACTGGSAAASSGCGAGV